MDGQAVESVGPGQQAVVVLDQTPFYAESGGQAGDCGFLVVTSGASARFEVSDCRKKGSVHLHIGQVLTGSLTVNARVDAEVDSRVRSATAHNHSATHLLHAALRTILGDHVTQQGSQVNSQRLRFDFSHPEAMSHEQVRAVEMLVNEEIRNNSPVQTELLNMEEARTKGAMALFGEKYGDVVRVLTMGGGFSVELCGGTHVSRTGDIGLMKVVSEAGIASGVRRIEAVTGLGALELFHEVEDSLDRIAAGLKATRANVEDKTRQLLEQNRQLTKEAETLKLKLASSAGSDILAGAKDINGVKVLATQVDGADAKTLRDLLDQVKSRVEVGVILLAAIEGDKVSLAAGVTNNLTSRVKAGDLIKFVSEQIGGKGGGRPDMAQGGGTEPAKLPVALASVYLWAENQLAE